MIMHSLHHLSTPHTTNHLTPPHTQTHLTKPYTTSQHLIQLVKAANRLVQDIAINDIIEDFCVVLRGIPVMEDWVELLWVEVT